MSAFDRYVQKQAVTSPDPRVRYWRDALTSGRASRIRCTFERKRNGLTFDQARIFVEMLDVAEHVLERPEALEWDSKTNQDLIELGARAADPTNESERFGMMLLQALERVVAQYGDGYFNAVLLDNLRNGPFAAEPTVQLVLERRPEQAQPSIHFSQCSEMIDNILTDHMTLLMKDLGYEQLQAEQILTGAVTYFLDERFNITNRRLLGLLSA